ICAPWFANPWRLRSLPTAPRYSSRKAPQKSVQLATFPQSIHHLSMLLRILLASLLLTASAWAGVVDDVRLALARNNFSAAESVLNSYRSQQGVNPEYLEAYSWMARVALDQGQYDQASAYAKQTKSFVLEQLKQRSLDSDPHLPIALGAALEVQSQALAARGQRTEAVALLQSALRTYGNTSIHDRLQKNLNLFSLQGRPTRLYGYTAQIEHASASDELGYIDAVRHRFYAGLLDMPVPISRSNFDTYGASTTPTLVLLDRTGRVAMYHPGALPYVELGARLERGGCGGGGAGVW